MEIDRQKIASHVNLPVMKLVGEVADELHRECYVVGGYVRDIFLERPCNDMDFVTVGSGIEVARAVAHRLGKRSHLSVFRTYGTAQVKTRQWELEFVGARRESYRRESRNPIVEDGTLDDDQRRRDFTINAMAICLNRERYGELLDPFDGIGDMNDLLIQNFSQDVEENWRNYIQIIRKNRAKFELLIKAHREWFLLDNLNRLCDYSSGTDFASAIPHGYIYNVIIVI